MKYFYQKYIVIENLIEELHSLDLSDGEKHHLSGLIDGSLHHVILDEILSNLSPEDKKVFLSKMKQDPESEELIEFLNKKIDKLEEKIRVVSEQLIKELHEDVKEAKKVK